MGLYLQTDNDGIRNLYIEQSKKISTDSGFDLFMSKDLTLLPKSNTCIDLEVRCQPLFYGGYYLYPRSSLGKTPLRLSNSVGIIDNEYRGTLKVWVNNTSDFPFEIKKGERYFQLCHPSLLPMKISVVERLNMNTSRGEGGFGSTGK
jgi:dUTP pyrophosphatase